MLFNNVFIGLVSLSMVMARPLSERVPGGFRPQTVTTNRVGRSQPLAERAPGFGSQTITTVTVGKRGVAEVDALKMGNEQFRNNTEASDPGLLKTLTDEGQAPDFMFLGCSDSRVSEGTIFNARPGTFFTARNIANQLSPNDANVHTTLSYAVAELGVKHVIVMGHYGCGGVGAAIATVPEGALDSANGAIQNWISPIRTLFETSSRPEIVELREKNKALAVVEEPEPQEAGFRALVEENVKVGVSAIAATSIIHNHNIAFKAAQAGNSTTAPTRRNVDRPIREVFVHGWVYDIENGKIVDLGISVGPPGVAIPAPSFEAVQAAGAAVAKRHAH